MRPLHSTHWQTLSDEFHMMVGYAVSAWAGVDDALFEIFRSSLGPYDQSAIIYYRTPGLDVRLGLTDEIVKSVLPPREPKSGGHEQPSVKAWNVVKSRFLELLPIRRRIAHHPVAIKHDYYRAPFEAGKPPPSWFEIYMSQHEQMRGKGSDVPALKIEDLQQHLIDVSLLQAQLQNFFHDVLTKPDAIRAAPSPQPAPEKEGDHG